MEKTALWLSRAYSIPFGALALALLFVTLAATSIAGSGSIFSSGSSSRAAALLLYGLCFVTLEGVAAILVWLPNKVGLVFCIIASAFGLLLSLPLVLIGRESHPLILLTGLLAAIVFGIGTYLFGFNRDVKALFAQKEAA